MSGERCPGCGRSDGRHELTCGAALERLRKAGLVDANGKPTELGRLMAKLVFGKGSP